MVSSLTASKSVSYHLISDSQHPSECMPLLFNLLYNVQENRNKSLNNVLYEVQC